MCALQEGVAAAEGQAQGLRQQLEADRQLLLSKAGELSTAAEQADSEASAAAERLRAEHAAAAQQLASQRELQQV
jgi:hypothetical protein